MNKSPEKQTKDVMNKVFSKVQHQMFKDINNSFKKNLEKSDKGLMTIKSSKDEKMKDDDEIFNRVMYYVVNSLNVTQVENENFRLKNTSIEEQYNQYIKNVVDGIQIKSNKIESKIDDKDKEKSIHIEFELEGSGSQEDQKAALAVILGGDVNFKSGDTVEDVVMEAHNSYQYEYINKVEENIESWLLDRFKKTVQSLENDYEKMNDKDKKIEITWRNK